MAKPSKPVSIGLATGALVLGCSVAAYAYRTAGGSRTGIAPGTDDLTVVQTSTVAEMAPGDSPQTLSGNFDNGNDAPVDVATVTASIASIDKAVGAPAGTCEATDYTLANAVMTVNAEVPPGDGQGSWSGATIQFNNKPAANQNACQGAAVTLAYIVS